MKKSVGKIILRNNMCGLHNLVCTLFENGYSVEISKDLKEKKFEINILEKAEDMEEQDAE